MGAPARLPDAVNGWNIDGVETYYERWKSDPQSLDPSWHAFFRGFELAAQRVDVPTPSAFGRIGSNGHASSATANHAASSANHVGSANGVAATAESRRASATESPVEAGLASGGGSEAIGIGSAELPTLSSLTSVNASLERRLRDQMHVDSLILSYRVHGHTGAMLDPLGEEPEPHPSLELENHGFTEADLHRVFESRSLPLPDDATLSDILDLLQKTYCGSIGAEFMYIPDREPRQLLAKAMESVRNRPVLDPQERRWILQRLIAAKNFETFLHRRYSGAKRFGLEGAESVIPLLDTIIENCPQHEVEEVQLGMAHRGRLNVLANIMGKTYQMICTEFEDTWEEDFEEGGGDVKYHRGYINARITRSGHRVGLNLASNPSHLEAVYPVMLGKVRGKQMLLGDTKARERVLPIAIHGDAAFAGQGVVYESLQLSLLDGYRVGGTIHVVINNQIGFTTLPSEGRSTNYCTDIAKMLNIPVFHVNGNDPEAVVHAAKLALWYRQEYHQDVMIDLYCYRLHGHNEGDEPTYTQPGMYEKIRAIKPVDQLYAEQLMAQGIVDAAGVEQMRQAIDSAMDQARSQVQVAPVDPTPEDPFSGDWYGIQPDYTHDPVATGVTREQLIKVADALVRYPGGFTVHPKVKQQMDARRKSIVETGTIDWGTAEALAIGTLLLEGTPVRISGQDARRGTFSHRHMVVVDQHLGEYFTPLDHIEPGQAHLCCYNSPLSEYAVLGFDYGYSLQVPRMLIVWEAQFGDFANGAQIVIDQFIASSEAKWERSSGLVMLLPHGYEGQGPEHSSARLERFLQLCADDNLEVVNPTTPAQLFHMLRRQLKRNFRKPLIVMSPKLLLRLPECVSHVSEFESGSFRTVLDDTTVVASDVRRVALCSGKIYYDLIAARNKAGRADLAVVRIEQLHPFPTHAVSEIIRRYQHAEFVWVQEEPRNAGAWSYIEPRLRSLLGTALPYIGRAATASPAVGSHNAHKHEQAEIVHDVLDLNSTSSHIEPRAYAANRAETAMSPR